MKLRPALSLLLISGILLLSGCGNKKNEDFQKDVAGLGDVYCRILEASHKLLAARLVYPNDTIRIQEMLIKKQALENEQAAMTVKFKQKYEKQMTDPKFVKNFSKEIKKSLLYCKYLSKEDSLQYQNEIRE